MSSKSEKVAQSQSTRRPLLEFLSPELVERIVAEALDVLSKVGVFVDNKEALALLDGAGATVDRAGQKARIPEALVWRCVRSAPSDIQVFNRNGCPALELQGLNVYFNPGSAAVKIHDARTGAARTPVTSDLVQLARLTDALPNYAAQSTALVPGDVPVEISDRYRLLVALLNSTKPVVTGTFSVKGFAVMRDMLAVVAGGEKNLRARPTAIFDACPSPPLKWSDLTAQSLIDCARSGLPAELVSMPLLGATAPVTLAGALVQHTAENLSGVVIHQLAQAGSPIIYGGSPSAFDMRHGTTTMGAMETAMLVCSYAQIGRWLGLPTHGYLGQCDSKLIDAQAGLESGIGAVLAAAAGVNVVSGPGMLEFESCQSLEKLVIDNDICGMAQRLVAGVTPRGERLAEDLFGDVSDGDHFLISPSTLKWMREEVTMPSVVIDRRRREEWQADGATDATQRASERVRSLLAAHHPKPLPDETRRQLVEIILRDGKRYGLDKLPAGL